MAAFEVTRSRETSGLEGQAADTVELADKMWTTEVNGEGPFMNKEKQRSGI